MFGKRLALSAALLCTVLLHASESAAEAAGAEGAAKAACTADQVPLKRGATITFEGDSLIYGLEVTIVNDPKEPTGVRYVASRSKAPFPETVGKRLNGAIRVVNHGYPGDRTSEALERWRVAATTQLTVIMLGTNDQSNYGHLPGGPLDVAQYDKNMRDLISRRISRGGRVILMVPPPQRNPTPQRNLEPYREAVRAIGRDLKLPVLDTSVILKADNPWTDGLHLSPQSNELLADLVASAICVEE